MKKLKQIFTEVKTNLYHTPDELNQLLWQLICYSPKMPVRFHQQQLLDEAEKFTLKAKDDYFAHRELDFKGFKWGTGKYKVLITHGWGSKAADFAEMITALREIDNLEIIAFDAPGNGTSEGELSNLLLFIEAVKAIMLNYGSPDIFIGHSLGGMANMLVIKETMVKPSLLISLAPLIRLKENFEASMSAADVPCPAQEAYLKSFETHFGKPADHYNLIDRYNFGGRHWLAYDQNDLISPYLYMEEFLNTNRSIERHNYENAGHEKIIKSLEMIKDLTAQVNKVLLPG
ncbi:MAG: Alpha/beta hydrolase family protein [Mucilaginibacter sp.]|nr:Alpha/beta hydrolase family protein [Mucilaginibacter sp.]